MALKLKCPCGERLVAPESAIGKRGKCSKCGRSFVIPDPNAARPKAAKVASAHSQNAAKAKAAAKPKVAAKLKAPDPDFPDLPDLGSGTSGFDNDLPDLAADLPDLGGGLGSDMGSELDDFLNEEISNPFQSPIASSTAAPEPSLAKSTTGSKRKEMETLANGIKLVFWGTVLGVLSGIAAIVAGIFLPVLALVAIGVGLLGGLLCTVGRIICLRGPSSVGGKGLIIAAVICDLTYIAFAVMEATGAINEQVGSIGSLFSLATWVLFVLFLMKVANSIGQPHLVEDARMILISVVSSIGLLIATPFILMLFPLIGIATGLGFIAAVFYAFFKYVNLLQLIAEEVRP